MRRKNAITEPAAGRIETKSPSSHGPCPFFSIQLHPVDGIWPDRNVNGMTTWAWFNNLVASLAKSSKGQMAWTMILPSDRVTDFKSELVLVTAKTDRKFSASLQRGLTIPGLEKRLETVLVTTHRSTKEDRAALDSWRQRTRNGNEDFDKKNPGLREARQLVAKKRRHQVNAKFAKR